jgi:hypothetical protein
MASAISAAYDVAAAADPASATAVKRDALAAGPFVVKAIHKPFLHVFVQALILSRTIQETDMTADMQAAHQAMMTSLADTADGVPNAGYFTLTVVNPLQALLVTHVKRNVAGAAVPAAASAEEGGVEGAPPALVRLTETSLKVVREHQGFVVPVDPKAKLWDQVQRIGAGTYQWSPVQQKYGLHLLAGAYLTAENAARVLAGVESPAHGWATTQQWFAMGKYGSAGTAEPRTLLAIILLIEYASDPVQTAYEPEVKVPMAFNCFFVGVERTLNLRKVAFATMSFTLFLQGINTAMAMFFPSVWRCSMVAAEHARIAALTEPDARIMSYAKHLCLERKEKRPREAAVQDVLTVANKGICELEKCSPKELPERVKALKGKLAEAAKGATEE